MTKSCVHPRHRLPVNTNHHYHTHEAEFTAQGGGDYDGWTLTSGVRLYW